MEEESRIYRADAGSALGGWIFFVIGSTLLIYSGIAYVLKIPFMAADSPSRVVDASWGALLLTTVISLPSATGGALLILHARRWRLTVNSQGVTITNMWGKEIFSASFADLSQIKRDEDPEGTSAFILAGSRKESLCLSDANYKELVAELKLRAPHIRSDR